MSARENFRALGETQLARREGLIGRTDRSGFAAATEIFAHTSRSSIFLIVLDTLIEMLEFERKQDA
jgi:hypothetical protein